MISKQVAPRSLIWRVFATVHVSVFHLHTKARLGDDFARVRGALAFEMLYKTFSSVGWNLGMRLVTRPHREGLVYHLPCGAITASNVFTRQRRLIHSVQKFQFARF